MTVNFVTFDEGEIGGYVDHQSSVKSAILGSTFNEHTFNFYVEHKPVKGYLVIVTESPPEFIKWRLWLNNFSLTKEFKPNLSFSGESKKETSFHIFDVTHLITSGKNELTISYNGARSLAVKVVSVVSIIEATGFHTAYSLRGGYLQLRPGDQIELKSLGRNYIVLKGNLREQVRIMNGKNFDDLIELNHECEEVEPESEGIVKVLNVTEASKASVQLLLHYTYKSEAPALDFDLIPNVIGNVLQIRIVNTGEVDIEKVTLNVMVNGVTASFRTITNVGKGRDAVCEVQIPPRKGNVLIRAVGIKAGLRRILDKELDR
ncbi:hypothetical protein GWK48_03160 [Metallosphaera tengchongensis]|uniref:Uncharacterized protein n=1 Tax=Metallosphaera tengchongensis TaxID=1532350 RepID=A0A6N0NTL4_9CREN|nr:hypothetical protein [Metallosphaera tengchongensis]QKQ99524.1 hypothetical protein GWK48_03160 [Metallosphaera tengchongensis]